MTKADDHYVQVAETLIEKLEQGTAPWQKPWDSGGYGSLPRTLRQATAIVAAMPYN